MHRRSRAQVDALVKQGSPYLRRRLVDEPLRVQHRHYLVPSAGDKALGGAGRSERDRG